MTLAQYLHHVWLSDLPAADRLILCRLASAATDALGQLRYVTAPSEALADHTGLSAGAVEASLRSLELAGWLVWIEWRPHRTRVVDLRVPVDDDPDSHTA